MTPTGRLAAGVVVRDAAAALRFYEAGLGLTPHQRSAFDGGRVVALRCGSSDASIVKLVELDRPSPSANPPGGLRGGTGLRYLTIEFDDLDAVVAGAAGNGGTIVEQTTSADGARLVLVADPDGNVIECKAVVHRS